MLKIAGASTIGVAALSGTASATFGKGISWVAWCGCDDGFCVQWRHFDDEGELVLLAYRSDCDTVYYKAGPYIYRHVDDSRGYDDVRVIDTLNAGDTDPIASNTSSDSRDPCGILDDSGGMKVETGGITSYAYDCSGGRTVPASDEDEDERRRRLHSQRNVM